MLTRYDPSKEEMIELTQEYFDKLNKKYRDMDIHYKEHSPENFQKFQSECILNNKVD